MSDTSFGITGHVYICIYVYANAYVYIYKYKWIYIYTNMCMCVQMYSEWFLHMHTCVRLCVKNMRTTAQTCIYIIYTYIFKCIYNYKYISTCNHTNMITMHKFLANMTRYLDVVYTCLEVWRKSLENNNKNIEKQTLAGMHLVTAYLPFQALQASWGKRCCKNQSLPDLALQIRPSQQALQHDLCAKTMRVPSMRCQASKCPSPQSFQSSVLKWRIQSTFIWTYVRYIKQIKINY